MKFYNIILFASLILYIFSIQCDGKGEAGSSDDCKDLPIGTGYSNCCFVKGKKDSEDVATCIPLTKNQYDNIKDYIKELEEDGSTDVKKLDCKSIYLELSILSFILLLL